MYSLLLNPIIVLTIAANAVVQFAAAVQTKPNFIVIQPDDHYFFEEWNPPGQFDGGQSLKRFPPNSNGLPNINRIREDGIEMESAYAASTMCGTSRYSTITGRYPSRSSYGRDWDQNKSVRDVRIPKTKLEDVRGVDDPNDCSENNIAALLKRNGYRTGVVGKWHLTSDDGGTYSYGRIQNDIKNCGFDFAEAIYKENMWGDWYGDATHNMEHITSEAIQFIQDSIEDQDKPFFLYFNPTVPHSSGDVTDALEYADCRDTVGGRLSNSPPIPFGMTADYGGNCRAYRKSVLDRGGRNDDKMAGAVWVDDAIGSLFLTLESMNILDNTFILFQLDHGEDTKGSLFEGGSRIAQFIHFPNLISGGFSFQGLVSTIDIAATVADIADVPENDRYLMDGKSWMMEVMKGNSEWSSGNDRCVIVEEGMDRSIRCGCFKYILVENMQEGFTVREARKASISISNNNYYNLCEEDSGMYINAPEVSPERRSTSLTDWDKSQLNDKIDCHLQRTNPSDDPVYDNKCDIPLGIVTPTKAPRTPSPTLRPSQSNQISMDDFIPSLWTDSSDQSQTLPPSLKTKVPISLPNLETTSPTKSPTILPVTATPTTSSTYSLKPSHHPSSLRPTKPPIVKPIPVSQFSSQITEGSTSDNFDSSNSTDIDFEIDCFDDLDYLYSGMDGQDCQWVINSFRCDREDPETKLHVGKKICPESCSNCRNVDGCFDNPYFQWYGREGFNCTWLEESGRCDSEKDSPDGSSMHIGRKFCPESCGYCSTDLDIEISK